MARNDLVKTVGFPLCRTLGLTGVTATRFAVALAALTMLIGPIAAKRTPA